MTLSFSFISEAKHKCFVKQVDDLLCNLKAGGSSMACLEEVDTLRDENQELEMIFNEYCRKAAELKTLVKRYNEVQHRARLLARQQTKFNKPGKFVAGN